MAGFADGGAYTWLVALVALGASAGLASCDDDAAARTQVFVWVDAQPAVKQRIDRVRVRIDRGDGSTALAPSETARLPVKLSLVPRSGVARQTFRVTAEALDARGVAFALARLESKFVDEEARHVRLVLEDACIDVLDCAPDRTCHAGGCVDAELDPRRFGRTAEEAPSSSELFEAPGDAGPRDAATEPDDGGAGDAAPVEKDAGPSMTPLMDCDDQGARKCGDDGLPWQCDGAHWLVLEACGMDERCDDSAGPTLGTCLPLASECEGAAIGEPFCSSEILRVCHNLVAYTDETCGAHAVCMVRSGAAACGCVEGFILEAGECVDVNECDTDVAACDSLTSCSNTEGSYECSACPTDYLGSGEAGCSPLLTELAVRYVDPRIGEQQVMFGRTESGLVPLGVENVELSPKLAPSGASVSFEGTAVAQDAWWPTPIAPGINNVNITVSEARHPDGAQVTYVVRGRTEAYFKAPNADGGDHFGRGVALSGPATFVEWPLGTTVVVGAPFEDGGNAGVNGDPFDNSLTDSGAAYVYAATTLGFVLEAYLKASNPGNYDQFGFRVAAAGDTVVVAASLEGSDANGALSGGNENASGSGAVYVFTRSAGMWSQQAMLKADNAGESDNFGDAIAISGDTIVVGAASEDSAATGVTSAGAADDAAPQSGAAYVFVRSGGVWTQQAYLKASNAGADDGFGGSVAIDGDMLVVGALGEASAATGVGAGQADDTAPSAGAAYVFTRSGSTWVQSAYLKASVPDEGDQFGYQVAVSGDLIAVSAPFEASLTNAPNDDSGWAAGAVYTFVRDAGSWMAQSYLKAPVARAGDRFGNGLALSADRLVVGASLDSGEGSGFCTASQTTGDPSGAIYVFERIGATCTFFAHAKASHPGSSDQFGQPVALSHEWILVGARGEGSSSRWVDGMPELLDPTNDDQSYTGAAYLLR